MTTPVAFFQDPSGNALLLHHRYAPRAPHTWRPPGRYSRPSNERHSRATTSRDRQIPSCLAISIVSE